jgi:hypothetical protein
MQTKIVAIHQPNFFPWLGFFDKIARSDIFVLMDNVQFPRTSRGCMCNRVKLLLNKEAKWVTAPVDRTRSKKMLIKNMRFKEDVRWRPKLIRSLQIHYQKAPHFKDFFPFVSALINNQTDRLAVYNAHAIKAFCRILEIDTNKIVFGSHIQAEGSATDLLIAMTIAAGGTVYMSGDGAGGYQQDRRFETAGLKLRYQNFVHPVYRHMHPNYFVPGLSIIDVLMHVSAKRLAAYYSKKNPPKEL